MRRVTSLLFGVLLFGLLAFTAQSYAQVQIGDGTVTGKALPIEPFYGYTYSQEIYLASEINASGDITTLSWYFAGSTLSNSNDWTIYIGHTSKSEFDSISDWIDVSTLTQVYSGEFADPGAPGWIEFDITDFTYNGVDNLVIAVDENKSSYNGSSDDFYCTTVASNRGLVYRNDNTNPDPATPPAASYNYPNIANIILGGIQQACPNPSALYVESVTTTSATIGWTPGGSETMWDVVYGEPGFDPESAGTLIPGVTDNPYTITGLSGATLYDAYVRADCGTDEVSAWTGPVEIATECDAITEFPFMEDFEGEAFLPVCWSKIVTLPNDITQSSTQNHTVDGQYSARFSSYSTGTDYNQYLFSPAFTIDENYKTLSFWHRKYNTSNELLEWGISTTTNPEDYTWTPVELSNTEWQQTIVDLSDYVGQTVYVGFHYFGQYLYYVYLDDFEIYQQTYGTLEGTVVEATRGPVENAHVTAGEYDAYTDASGYYIIEDMLPGYYEVTCDADGYLPMSVDSVEVVGLETTVQDFELGYAQISVTPASLDETLLPDATATQTLTISNPAGTNPLEWGLMIEEVEPAKQSVSIPRVPRVTSGDAPSELKAPSTSMKQPKGDFDVLRGSNAYAFDLFTDEFVTFDTDTPGAYSSALPVTQTVYAGDFDGSNTFYAVDNDAETLNIVDLATGAFTEVGPTISFSDLAWDYTTGVMYGVDWNGTNTELYTLDLTNGSATYIGDVTDAGLIISIAIDGDGVLYGFTISTDELIAIDKATAAPTVIGAVGFDGNYAQSMAWDPFSDIIYMAAYNNTLSQGELRVVDKVTGATSLVGAFPGGAELGGLGFMGQAVTWLTADPVSGVVNPGETADVLVTFDATGLIDSTYLANINISHNGQEVTDGTVNVPVSLTVASSIPPELPTNLVPEDGAEFVALQPVFSWTNGAGTAQVRFTLTRGVGPFAQNIYTSEWFVGNSIDLSEVGITLLPKTTYGWIVAAKNAAGVVSTTKITFTTIGTGTISGIVTDSYTGNPIEGATITADAIRYEAVTGPEGTYDIPDVIEGDYTVTAEANGYVTQSQPATVVNNQNTLANFELDQYLDPPFGLQAEVMDFTDVNLHWNAPGGAFTPEWLTYSDDVVTNSIGTDAAAQFDVAARYEPDQLTAFPGGSITKIQFVPGEPDITCTYTLKVWAGTEPPTLIYQQELASVVSDEWNEVTLDTPVPFDNTEELWFGFGVNTTGGFPAGCDAGPQIEGFSNMIYWDGAWTTLTALNADLTYNWAVKAYVEAAKGSGVLDPVKQKPVVYNNQGTPELNPVKIQPAAVSPADNSPRAFQGYNLYKDGELLAYTTDTSYMDENLTAGSYSYQLTAVYDEGESDPIGPVTVSILPAPVITAATPDYFGVDVMWVDGSKASNASEDVHELTSNVGYDILLQKKMGTYKPADPIQSRCTVDCPPEAIEEGEPCLVDDDVDVTNGGCNSDPAAFSPIQIGDVICGTASTYTIGGANNRDTDWYELVIDQPKTITWSVEAEFPLAIFILDGNDGCEGLSVIASTSADTCTLAELSATLPPGTYWLFAGPSVFEGVPCGDNNNYVATLTGVDTFLSYYNVFRDGELYAPGVYDMGYYDDAVVNGETYCYSVSKVVNEAGLETPQSMDSCATVPLIPVASVDPDSLSETHFVPPAQVTTQTVTIMNDGEGMLDWDLSVFTGGSSLVYCDASTTSEYEYIGNVMIGDIDNSSDWQAGVADYSYLSTQITPGGSLDILVTNGNPYSEDLVTVWVDWNGNSTFDVGTDEEFILVTNDGASTFEGTIVAPADAAPGDYRMRVRMTDGSFEDPAPCGVASWGEVEDYTLSIGEPWLSVDVTSGTLGTGESQDITVTFNSASTSLGVYSGALDFTTNDPYNMMFSVPVNFEVVGATGTLMGYVTDATSRGPVQGVTITADGIRESTTTNAEGYYELTLAEGYYSVTASKDGYISQTVDSVEIQTDMTEQVDFMLEFAGPVLLYADGGVAEINLGWASNPSVDGSSVKSGIPATMEEVSGELRKEKNPNPIEITGREVGETCAEAVTALIGVNSSPQSPYWYEFTPDTDGEITISSCMDGQSVDTDLEVYDACDGNLVASNDDLYDACSSYDYSSAVTFVGQAGVSYKIAWLDTWSSTSFDFTIEVNELCVVECPPEAIVDPEPCPGDEYVDTYNGGCNSDPAVFTQVNCGDVICGTASTYSFDGSNRRDTDWFELVLDGPKVVTFTLTAEFPALGGLLEQVVPGEPGCGNLTGYIAPNVSINPCEDGVIEMALPPGTYYFFVSPSVFTGYPCGTQNNYVASFECADTFISYFNVFRDGEQIGQTYRNTYSDTDIVPDTEYCYTVNQVVEPGLETPESNELCASMLCPTGCDYTMNFVDDYGDGWNGAAVTILQGGATIGSFTLASGTAGTAVVTLCDASETSLVWTEGGYDSECGFTLLDPMGDTLTSFEIGNAPVGGEFFNFTTACPVMPEQLIAMEQDWNAWSSYINPNMRMGMDELMNPVMDEMIITKYFSELLYPEYGINTMGDFSNQHGYFTKLSAAATLPISGYMADPTVNIPAGWSLFPVLQECPIPAADVFSAIPGFIIAWDPVGNGIYYPAEEMNTLGDLNPGMAYWIKVDADASYTYPGCTKASGAYSKSPRPVNNTNWNDVNFTPVNHAVIFDANATAGLHEGDMIGAFTTNNWCAGMAEYKGGNLGINLFGDDLTTDMADGYVEGEPVTFRVFRPATEEEFDMNVTYDYKAPNADGMFAINGISVVTDLKLSPTSIGENLLNGLNIYPNPSSGVFNIAIGNMGHQIDYVVMNAQGQEVYSGKLDGSQELDLSAEPKGVYFIRFIDESVLGIEKLVIK